MLKLFHFHKWKVSAVTHGTYVWGGGTGTSVLYVYSKCGDSKVKVLNGSWTLEQLENKKKD